MFDNILDSKILLIKDRLSDPSIKVVSFDIFDTLVRRPFMKPEHLFFAMAEDLPKFGVPVEAANRFGEARIIAGHRANHYGNLFGTEDVNLDVIYTILVSMLPALRPFAEDIKQLEISKELSILEPYPLGKALYDCAKRNNKRIVISSDQYLPKKILEIVLENNGYDGYEHFFLSGDIGALKATGTLFEWLPVRLGVLRREIFHIGDNPHSDFSAARSKGLQAGLIPQSIELSRHAGLHSSVGRHATLGSVALARYLHKASDEVVLRGFSEFKSGVNFLGYTFYGPVLAGIATWLVERLKKQEVDKIFLLARDSEGLSKVIALMYPEYASKFDYVYASRRLLVYPSDDLTGNEVFRHYKHFLTGKVSAHQFLEKISGQGVDLTPLKSNFSVSDLMNSSIVQHKMEKMIDSYYGKRRLEREGWKRDEELLSYYKQYIGDNKKIGLFDIGWRGNLQRSLEGLFFDQEVEFHGLYIGTIYEHELPKRVVNYDALAFACNYPINVFDEIAPNIWPLELIFSGSHPSVVGIRKMEKVWSPVYEQDTKIKAKLRELSERFQYSAIEFINDMLEKNKELLYNLSTKGPTIQLLREFVAYPAWIDAHFMSDLVWTPNIDEDEGASLIVKLGSKASGRQVVKAKDSSQWPAGYEALLSHENRQKRHEYYKLRDRVYRIMSKNRYVYRAFCIVKTRFG